MPEFHWRAGRAPVETSVSVTAADDSYTGVTKNIGVGGLFLATSRLRPVGDRLELTFTLPGEVDPISVETEVRWSRDDAPEAPEQGDRAAGMGVRFVALTKDAALLIQRFLRLQETLARNGSGPFRKAT